MSLTSYQTAPPRGKLFFLNVNCLKFVLIFFYIVYDCLLLFQNS